MNVLNRAAAHYANVGALTASPVTILRMLHDGILRFAGEARDALSRGDREHAAERASKAADIFEHLASTLDVEKAPEVADSLLSVYGFCLRRLGDARASGDCAPIDEVVSLTRELRDTWAEVERQTTTSTK
jgi:flagellar secretion chaperone FliS